MPTCTLPVDDFFADEVWAKVGAVACLTCHKAGGDAEKSAFVLRDPSKLPEEQRTDGLRFNRAAFARMAAVQEGQQSRLLLKVTGGLEHGGSDVLAADSTGYRILEELVRRVQAPPAAAAGSAASPAAAVQGPALFEGVALVDDRRLLRRATLSLAGRLPTEAELKAVESRGSEALPELLWAVMQEEAFYLRLREGLNDIFLTIGYDDGAESALSYDHFSKTRHWTQKHDLSHVGDENAQRQARYKLTDDYRAALLGEPMRLVDYIVRHDRPFTELVTADYIMVSPYTARGYGIYEEIKERFQNPDDPFEYVPVRLKALVGREKSQHQESATGYYPHAGMLGMFQYLRRYPTTETNRNRLRARMYYQHFLGVDVLELAARVSDAAAVSAKYEIPTMQAAECVVCHKTVDPVAGLFQDYFHFSGVYGRRKGGWFPDMFGAGFEGEELPAAERWRALQWLGERTAGDPRFASTMVEHVYYVLTGRPVLLPPKDVDDPLFAARRRAYLAQRCQIDQIASRFAAQGYNLKRVFQDWILSDFYRADGLTTALANPERRAELEDLGVVRLLSPEQLERKVGAVFGQPWGRLKDQLATLYGGIDSREVTERAVDPSGAMGAIQRILSNDVACKQTARDFGRPQDQRRLFPLVEADLVPGQSPEGDAAIRRNLVHLHQLVLGQEESPDGPDIQRSFRLLAGIAADAAEQKGLEKREIYSCRQSDPPPPADPLYMIRAWRGVVTYLLRRPEFLYE